MRIFKLIILSGVLLSGCLSFNMKVSSKFYQSAEHDFKMNLPPGWQEDPPLSNELTKQARQEDKDAVAVLIRSDEKVDLFGLNLMIAFLPTDSNYQDSFQRQKYIEKLKGKLGGTPTDQVYLARETTISGQPAVQLAICTAYEGLHGRTCNIVHHITEVFSQQTRIRIQFNVWKKMYSNYQEEIERSIASIEIRPRNESKAADRTAPMSDNRSTSTLPCEKEDIQVLEHKWEKSRIASEITIFNWEATVKNISKQRCIVTFEFELFDENGNILVRDISRPPQVFDPEQIKRYQSLGSNHIKTKFLPKVHSSRVVILNVE